MSLHTIYDEITLIISTIFYGLSEAMKATMDLIWNADLTLFFFGVLFFIVILGAVFAIKDFIEGKDV